MGKKSRSKATRAYLAAQAESSKPSSDTMDLRQVPNRADLRHSGYNITNRTGRPNARLKKARASHKKKAGEV